MVNIDPQMRAILDDVRAQNRPSRRSVTLEQARADSLNNNKFWNEESPDVEFVQDVLVDGKNEKRGLRLYKKSGLTDPAPVLLYIHGGGWVLCSLDTHDGVCRRLATMGNFAVASLDYGLAPEHPFPEPVEDCISAGNWLSANGMELGLDPSRMAIGGDSAGANLSLATLMALRDRGQPLFQAGVLVYGMFDDDFETESHKAFGEDFFLSTDDIKWFWEQYLPDPAKRHDPLAAPLHGELSALPPLFVSAAGLDPLRDDSEKLAKKLGELGADYDYHLWHGVTHACIMMSRRLDRADDFIREMAGFVDTKLVG